MCGVSYRTLEDEDGVGGVESRERYRRRKKKEGR